MKCFVCRKRTIPARRFYSPLGHDFPYFVGAKYCSEHCAEEARALRKALEVML